MMRNQNCCILAASNISGTSKGNSSSENSSFFLAKHGEEATEKETHLPLFFYDINFLLSACICFCFDAALCAMNSQSSRRLLPFFSSSYVCASCTSIPQRIVILSRFALLRFGPSFSLVRAFGCIKIWREGRNIQRLGGGKRREANEKDRTTSRREILFFSFSCTYRHYNSDQVSKRMNHHQNTTTRRKRK